MKNEIDFIKDNCKKDFGILKKWTNTKHLNVDESIENLQNLLKIHLKSLLDNDFSSLLNILYKADVSENKVKAAFDNNFTSNEIAVEIAKLYIDRMIKKWNTRIQFSTQEKGDW